MTGNVLSVEFTQPWDGRAHSYLERAHIMISPADPVDPRIDIVCLNENESDVVAVRGTPSPRPENPDIPANWRRVALIFVAPSAEGITEANIVELEGCRDCHVRPR